MGEGAGTRERRVIDTFIGLADTLASDYEVAELLQLLVERCREVLGVHTAGVLLETAEGQLRLAAALSEDMDTVEEVELGADEGPCVEAYRGRQPVIVPDLAECEERWPSVVPRLLDLGMRAGHAFPIRLRDDCIGAMNLYRREPGGLDEDDIRLAQAMADMAAVGILQQRTVAEARERAEQLQHALDSRVVIEQAKGMLAQRHQITPREAFEALRSYARAHNAKVREVSARVVDGVIIDVVRGPTS